MRNCSWWKEGKERRKKGLSVDFCNLVASAYPTNVGITRGTPSVATLVVVSDGVAIRVALKGFYITYSPGV